MTTCASTRTVASLKQARDAAWAAILKDAPWAAFILAGDFDARLYGIYLIETYHYVMHNPRHQALVGALSKDQPFNYTKFCYEHAEEETGHEMMAYHDLASLGSSNSPIPIPPPHPSTEVFIAYLYWVSTHGNPLRRLGYSFWAEDSYSYIEPIVRRVKETLGLESSQMTFIISHATIDEKHSQEIEEMIGRFCKIEEDWLAVEDVMNTSLRLQSEMLGQVVNSYQTLNNGGASPYAFLNSLVSERCQNTSQN
jgi:thiaminase